MRFLGERQVDQEPLIPELPEAVFEAAIIIQDPEDPPITNRFRKRMSKVFDDLTSLCGVNKAMTRKMLQICVGIRAMFHTGGYFIDTEVVIENLKILAKNWPDRIPMDDNGQFKNRTKVKDMGRLRDEHAALFTENFEFQFPKLIRTVATWHTRRTRFDNVVQIIKILMKMREELGYFVRAWTDPIILDADRTLYVGTFVDKRHPERKYQRCHFMIGNPTHWLRCMFNTIQVTEKKRGDIRIKAVPRAFVKNDAKTIRVGELLQQLRTEAVERLMLEAEAQAWAEYEERDSGASNNSNPEQPVVVDIDQIMDDQPLREPEQVEVISADNIRYVPESDSDSDSDETDSDESSVNSDEITWNNDVIPSDISDTELGRNIRGIVAGKISVARKDRH